MQAFRPAWRGGPKGPHYILQRALLSEHGGRRDKAANLSFHELGEAQRRMVLENRTRPRDGSLAADVVVIARPANATTLFASFMPQPAELATPFPIVPESSRQKGEGSR